MIQALNIKNIDPKALKNAKGTATGEAQALDPESMLENADFANELMASLAGEEAELKVQPVQVSPEQMMENPSSLIKLPQASPDAINPKVFDPSITKGVDKITQPKTTAAPVDMKLQQLLNMQAQEVNPELADVKVVDGKVVNPKVLDSKMLDAKAVNGELNQKILNPELESELTQAMLKTPQVQSAQVGRAPALDLAKAEIDPQLLNMDDFVAHKNMAVKKSLNNASAYGMPNKGAKVAGIENGLKSTQTVNELGAAQGGTTGSESAASGMKSQQFILSSQIDLGANAQANEAAAPKTFNMSHIKTDNPNQILSQITDYIVQAKAAKEPTVNMRMNHDELGMIDITVNKVAMSQDNAIAINIGTHSVDGKNFFQANSKDLFSHLTSTGLNVSDLKVETPSQSAKNEFDFGSQSGRGGSHGQEKQFGSEQNQRKHEQERRQELWNLFKDKEAA